MAISIATASGVVSVVSRLVQPQSLCAASTAAEIAFNFSLQGGRSNYKPLQFIRETAIAYNENIQTIFNAINAGTVLYYSLALVGEVLEKEWAIMILPACFLMPVTYVIARIFLNRHFKPPASRVEDGVEISEELKSQQQFAQRLHLTQLVLSVALACFAQNPLPLIFTIQGAIYNFFMNSRLKWLKFSRTFNFPVREVDERTPPEKSGFQISQAKVVYNMLMLPVDHNYPQDDCSICQDEDIKVEVAFCADHVFHQSCLIDLIKSKSDSFNDATSYTRNTEYTKDNFVQGKHSYSVDIPENSLPSCPNCRDVPIHNNCDITIADVDFGISEAEVNIQRKNSSMQPFFERVYLAYNIVQASLAFLQQYPELAATIFKIQELLLITDCIGYAFTLYFLYNAVQQMIEDKKFSSLRNNVTLGVAFVFGMISYLFILKLNAYLRSSLLLKQVFEKLPVSSVLKNLQMGWGAPGPHQFMQWLYVNRIVASVALSFFSKNRAVNILSAGAMSFSFLGVSSLRWVEATYQQTIAREALDLDVTAQFMVSSFCTKSVTHLKSSLQSIHTYLEQLFDKSKWDESWLLENGYRSIGVDLHNQPLQPCACTLSPYLDNISTVAHNYGKYGAVKFH